MDVTPQPLDVEAKVAPRRRRRVSLRVLMLLILCLGLWLGWRVHRARRQGEAVAGVKALGGELTYDWEFADDGRRVGRGPQVPEWLRRAIGDEYFQDVVEVNLIKVGPDGKPARIEDAPDDLAPILGKLPELRSLSIMGTQATDGVMEVVGGLGDLETLTIETFFNWEPVVTDAGVAKLRGLSRLKKIHIDNAKLGDESLRHLSALPQLEIMSLQGNRFTDAGLAHLRGMTTITELFVDMSAEPLTDAGLAHLRGLNRLEDLGLQYTKVTDSGLRQLEGLTNLKTVFVTNSAVTEEGKARLREKLPNLMSIQ